MRFTFSYTATHFVSHRRQYFAIIILMAMSVLLIGSVLYLRVSMESRLNSCEEILAVDSDRVLIVHANGHGYRDVPNGKIVGVDAIGTYCEDRIVIHKQPINAIRVSCSLHDLVKLSLQEGEAPDFSDESHRFIFLGADVDVAKVGDTVTWQDYSENKQCEAIVCGRLTPQSRWLNSVESFRGKIDNVSVSLDDKILCFSSLDMMPDSEYILVTGRGDIETKQRACAFMEKQVNHAVTISYLSDIFDVADMDNKGIVKMLGESVWLVILVTIVLMACLQTVIVLNFRKTIGIWYSNGVSRKQAIGVFGGALILATFVSLCISGLVLVIVLRSAEDSVSAGMWEVVRERVLVKVFAAVIVMDFLGFLLPLHTLLSGKPSVLLREFRK